ncbi:MAG: hypothetical protein OEX00_05975 [Gammaproteobacteria bacterium]|nr:hypothetical protein [Gammaproteobacteria bacterium]MDH5692029.1 hypothetical protein [Gammaproteobacteria bacterium]
MDQIFKENLHIFMIGLGVACVLVVGLMFAFYLKIKKDVAKKKMAE